MATLLYVLKTMFASSQVFGTQPGAAGAGTAETAKPRQEDKQTCLPVTLRSVELALATRAGSDELKIHGSEPAFVIAVGVIETLVQQAVGLEFQLNDATARMKVRSFSAAPEETAKLAAGKYVEVVGSVRTSPEPHLSAQWLRLVEAADEVSYHMIAAAHAALVVPKGPSEIPIVQKAVQPVVAAQKEAPVAMDTSPPKAHVVAAAAPASDTTAPVKGNLKEHIVAALKKAEGNDMGLSVSELATSSPSSSADEVRRILKALVDDGEVFNTVDEEHFSLL